MTLTSLEAELSRAKEGSRELDALLWLQFDNPSYRFIAYTARWQSWRELGLSREDVTNPDCLVRGLIFRDDTGNVQCFNAAPDYTTSIDAALALVERIFPSDVFWRVSKRSDGTYRALVDVPVHADMHSRDCLDNMSSGPTPALAICLAAVRALIARDAP